MKRLIILLLLVFMAAKPSHALNILQKIIYKEVRIGQEKVLVNKLTDKVEKKLVDNQYSPISAQKGWGGIPSEQDMYQARYDRIR